MSVKNSTSHHALIVGMTNTDQVAWWQAKAPAAATIPDGAERIPDAGDGGDDGGGDGVEVNDIGLTAEEQAEFDRMAQGGDDDPEPPPAGDEIDGDPDGDPDDTIDEAPAAGPLGKEKTPAELAAEAATGKKPAPKTVSFGKHQREMKNANAKITALETAERRQREDNIKLAERVAIINEALAAQAAAATAPAVDPNAPPENPFEEADIDPTVDYAESVKQIQRRQRYQMEHNQRFEGEVAESREDTQLRDTFQRDFAASQAADPTLPDAYQFLKDSRLTEICISEFDKDPNDPEQIFTQAEITKMVQIFNAEEKWVVGNAIKANKSPSAAIKKLARARGWKPAAPAPAAAARPAPGAPAVRNGAPRPAPGAAPAVPSAAAALADLAAAKEAGKSLSDGGGAPPQGLSAELLLQLSDEEFAAMVDDLPKHQLDALMGRAPGQ